MGDLHPLASAQVLTNPDLLHDIFTKDGNRDSYLAQYAIVCRTFHEPVIRVLWRNLDALLPLWHLLAPPDAPFPFRYYHNRGLDDHSVVLAYLQKVSSAQLHLNPIRWERFLWHATHVRGIGHLSHGLEAINDAARLLAQTVVMQNGGITVLPLLRTIEWRASAPVFGPDCALIPFFTSTLRRATFDLSRPDEAEIILLLRRLRESSPFLEKISIDTGSQPDTSPSIIRELLSFARLDQIQVSQTGPEGFQALATKSNLTYLKVCEVTGPWVGSGRAISVRDLRDLSVRGDASALSGLFNVVRFQALKSAKIGLKSFSEGQVALADIMVSLAHFYKAVSMSGLQTFELTVCSPTLRLPGNEPALRDLLAPLLPIHDLRLFRLVAMDSIASIDDADIEALASAWPKVERLFIHEGINPDSTVSIGAFHHLYRHCTHLKELHISGFRFPIIGVHEIPAPLDRSLSHPLQHLSMRGQYVLKTSIQLLGPDLSDEGAEAMARYLLVLFPRLDIQRLKRQLDDSSPERRGVLPEVLHFDDRWRRIIGHIYAIGTARDGP